MEENGSNSKIKREESVMYWKKKWGIKRESKNKALEWIMEHSLIYIYFYIQLFSLLSLLLSIFQLIGVFKLIIVYNRKL